MEGGLQERARLTFLLPFSSLCYKVASRREYMLLRYDWHRQRSSFQQGQGYQGLAVVIYQPNHISSSFLRR